LKTDSLQRYLQKTLGKFVGIGDAFLRNDRADYDKLVSVLEHIESGTLTEDNFSDKLPERWADEITKKSPRNRYDDDAAWLCAVSGIIHEILNSLIMIQDGTPMGMWRKRRFQRYLQKTLGKSVGIGDAFLRNDRLKYDQLVSVLEDIESGTLTEHNFSDKVPDRWAHEIIKKSPRNRYDDDAAWLCAVSEIIHETLNGLIMMQHGTTTLSYEMAIDGFADSEQSVNDRIDAKIDKDIKALGQIKTMKAMGIGHK
jgi:hypothetical protein